MAVASSTRRGSVWLRADEPPRAGSAAGYLRWVDRMQGVFGRAAQGRRSAARVSWKNLSRQR